MSKDYDDLLRKELIKHGYYRKRSGKGSHEIWYSDETQESIAVSRRMGRILANSLLKQAKIDKKF